MKAINTLYVPSELAKSDRLNAGELFILANIGYRCSIHGSCTDRVYHKEGRTSFAELLGRNGSSISRTIHALADKGYLAIEQTMHNGKKSFLKITGTSKLMAFFIKGGKRVTMNDSNGFIPVKVATIKAVGVKLAYTMSLIVNILHKQHLMDGSVSLGANFHKLVGVSRNTLTNHLKALKGFIDCDGRIVNVTVAGAKLCLEDAACESSNGLIEKATELLDAMEGGFYGSIEGVIKFIERAVESNYRQYGFVPRLDEIDYLKEEVKAHMEEW